MEHFSINAIKLGGLLFLCMYLSNMLYSLIAKLYKIRIIGFGIFSDIGFSIHKTRVKGIEYILGWFPSSSHIKLLGMTDDVDEQKLIRQSDLPYTFFNKPTYIKIIFRIVPYCIFLLVFMIAFIMLYNGSNILNALIEFLHYIKVGFFEVITLNNKNINFAGLTNELRGEKNIVLFSGMLMAFILFLLSPISNILHWVLKKGNKKSFLINLSKVAVTILILWVYIWKFPRFLFSFFTLSQNVFYCLNFILGMFISGVFFYFFTLVFAKYVLRNFESDN